MSAHKGRAAAGAALAAGLVLACVVFAGRSTGKPGKTALETVGGLSLQEAERAYAQGFRDGEDDIKTRRQIALMHLQAMHDYKPELAGMGEETQSLEEKNPSVRSCSVRLSPSTNLFQSDSVEVKCKCL